MDLARGPMLRSLLVASTATCLLSRMVLPGARRTLCTMILSIWTRDGGLAFRSGPRVSARGQTEYASERQ